MPLLTAAEAHDRGVGLALSESALQDVIDDEEAEMIRRFGAHGNGVSSVTEIVQSVGRSVYLRRPIVSVTSVTEMAYPGATPSTIAATNRYTWPAEGRIELYPGGLLYPAVDDNRRVITVIYVPIDDRTLRKQVLLELVGAAVDQMSATAGGKVSGLSFRIEDSDSNAGDVTRARAYRRLEFFST